MTVDPTLRVEGLLADVADVEVGEFVVLLELESRHVLDVRR
jgi:hypothetical protein